jgi:hypothetical protein
MVCIGQNHLSACFGDIFWHGGPYKPGRAYWHERRGLNRSMIGGKLGPPCPAWINGMKPELNVF